MAATSFSHVAVAPGAEAALQIFHTNEKLGAITITFRSEPYRDNLGITKAQPDMTFNIFESTDRTAWGTALNTPAIVVKSGGDKSVTVISRKPWLKVAGSAAAGSKNGYCKIDVFFQGMQYFGFTDLEITPGKSGFPTTGAGAETFVVGAWPLP